MATADNQRITLKLIIDASICFLGSSLQNGYNLAVINTPQLLIEDFFHDVKYFKRFLWPFAVSLFFIGAIFGCIGGSHLAKRVGRKKTLILNNGFAIVGGILLCCTKVSQSVVLLCFGRFLVGINGGINIVVSPMYLSEIAPVRVRGKFGTMASLGFDLGIFVASIFGLNDILGNKDGLPYLLGLTAVISILQLMIIHICLESPRWLIGISNKEAEGTRNLQILRGVDDVTEEINEIKRDVANELNLEQINIVELFRNTCYRKPLLNSVMIQLSQQLSGNNVVLNYSTSMFVHIGLKEESSQLVTCAVGGICALTSLVAVFLVEKVGRRKLLLISQFGTILSHAIITLALIYIDKNVAAMNYVGVIAILASVGIFQLGLNPIPFFITSELFAQKSVSAATTVTGPINRITNCLVIFSFPMVNELTYPYTFLIFAILQIVFFVITFRVVPETKGLTITEINEEMFGRVLRLDEIT